MTERETLILLNMVKGLGAQKIKRIFSFFDDLSVAVKNRNKLNKILGDRLTSEVFDNLNNGRLKQEMKLLEKTSVEVLTVLDEKYPFLLEKIYSPPIVLYLKGYSDCISGACLGVVGSREASSYGINSAYEFASSIVNEKITIVSGLAKGIDTAAHKGALRGGGLTVAVLGSGLLNVYPKENKFLFEEIVKQGCVISEFSLQSEPAKENFPRRNRIISGLSRGVFVIEARAKSGALITANCALEQGREVFALPGRIDNSQSKGVNSLIKEGAVLVENVEDIFNELKGLSFLPEENIKKEYIRS